MNPPDAIAIPDSIIVIDDETHVRKAAEQTLELAGYQVHGFARAGDALALISREWAGIVVSDVRMPQMDGMELLQKVQSVDPDLPVVLITGHGDITMAVQAMRDGAYDFLEKPFRADVLSDVVRRAMEKRALVLENRSLRRELKSQTDSDAIILGRSPEIIAMRDYIAQIAATDADVLVNGETGTGKELVARGLHLQSRRASKPFVAVNCAAIPESIMESELFGHEAGTFTGAGSRHIGKFEYANGGTVFLDEIESMPLSLGAKLLRVLQERSVERLGSHQPIPLDIRVVAASKVDLKAASARGEFREDLYYRLNVVEIHIPPLRKRREDIPLLFQHFVDEACRSYNREPTPLDAIAQAELMRQEWPGNVRELRNAANRYVLGCITGQSGRPGEERDPPNLSTQVEAFEKTLLAQALQKHQGNVTEVGEALGLPRKTLYDKLRKHGLSGKDFR